VRLLGGASALEACTRPSTIMCPASAQLNDPEVKTLIGAASRLGQPQGVLVPCPLN
jgi:hypothetical protein